MENDKQKPFLKRVSDLEKEVKELRRSLEIIKKSIKG